MSELCLQTFHYIVIISQTPRDSFCCWPGQVSCPQCLCGHAPLFMLLDWCFPISLLVFVRLVRNWYYVRLMQCGQKKSVQVTLKCRSGLCFTLFNSQYRMNRECQLTPCFEASTRPEDVTTQLSDCPALTGFSPQHCIIL